MLTQEQITYAVALTDNEHFTEELKQFLDTAMMKGCTTNAEFKEFLVGAMMRPGVVAALGGVLTGFLLGLAYCGQLPEFKPDPKPTMEVANA